MALGFRSSNRSNPSKEKQDIPGKGRALSSGSHRCRYIECDRGAMVSFTLTGTTMAPLLSSPLLLWPAAMSLSPMSFLSSSLLPLSPLSF